MCLCRWRERLANEVAYSKFAALISDGSTDAAVVEQEIVYISFAKSGERCVKFLGSVATARADAEGVTASIKRAVESGLGIEFPEFAKKLVAIGTDGASVNTGQQSGVIARIRREFAPSLVGVHCYAHCLELACGEKTSSLRSSWEAPVRSLALLQAEVIAHLFRM